jgi:hypothetical protein
MAMQRWPVSCAVLVAAICGCGNPVLQSARGDPQAGAAARPLCRDLEASTPRDRMACDKNWSVLVYMMADAPELAPYALWNLHQMEGRLPDSMGSAASGRDADIVVELDLDQPPGIRRVQVLGGRSAFIPLHAIEPDAAPADTPRAPIESPVIELIDEAQAEATPATPRSRFSDFRSWGIAHYPARPERRAQKARGARGYTSCSTTKRRPRLGCHYEPPFASPCVARRSPQACGRSSRAHSSSACPVGYSRSRDRSTRALRSACHCDRRPEPAHLIVGHQLLDFAELLIRSR